MTETTENVTITIDSDRYDMSGSFNPEENGENENAAEHDTIKMTTDGKLNRKGKVVSLIYPESELTGMEGSDTEITFNDDTPELLSMIRSGNCTTALTFEPGRRHICVYNTPVMPFEVCIRTYEVDNRLLDDGYIYIDYSLEIHGARAERNRLKITAVKKSQE